MTAVTPGRTGNQFNLVAQARRQPGSTFKVFVLTAAINEGMNPDTTYYTSAPFDYQPDPYTPAWDVQTYDHSYAGSISVTQGTLRSDNTVYAQLTLDVGPDKVAQMAHRLGIRSKLDVVPAMGPARTRSRRSRRLPPMRPSTRGASTRGRRPSPRSSSRTARSTRTRAGQAAPQARGLGRSRLGGDAHPAAERPRRHGRGRVLRPARRRQDRHDRQPRGRMVLGYVPQLQATVWVGYPQGEIPMTNVHGFPSRAAASRPRSGTCSWRPR